MTAAEFALIDEQRQIIHAIDGILSGRMPEPKLLRFPVVQKVYDSVFAGLTDSSPLDQFHAES